MLTVFLDFKSAGSLLALDPVMALANRLGLALDWRPFSTAERDIPDSGADTGVIESHRLVREQSRRAMDQKYAKLRGMELVYPQTQSPTDLALGALTEISGDPLPYIRAAFDAYWTKHLFLDDPEIVSGLLAESGVQHSGELTGTRTAFETAQSTAETAGVVEAPAFLIDSQLFIGRQHLPWIEEIAREVGLT